MKSWLADLRQLTADNPEQQKRLDEMLPLISQRLALLNERIELRREKGFQAAAEAVTTRQGTDLSEKIQTSIGEMRDAENGLLLQREQTMRADTKFTETVILVATALAAVLGFFAVMLIRRDLAERKKAEELLRESEERYRTLFDSIDEGYCIVEMIFDARENPVDFRFLQINPSFERQTGLRGALGFKLMGASR